MNFLKNTFPALLIILLVTACQTKKAVTPPDLSKIDLKRGEVLLCGDGQFGDVVWSMSCSYETREDFDLALALLHSFEYAEAEKGFVTVIDKDPECVMAYWGVCMSIYHSLWSPPSEAELKKANALLAIADDLPQGEREERYITAIGTYFKDWKTIDHKTRAKNYELAMEKMHQENPDDVEAAVLYALALISTSPKSDHTYTNNKKAGAILESLFEQYPNHPGIAHYVIHTYDNPELAGMALETARKYSDIAPSSAHAQHMPSHIFTRLGLWQESIESNKKSAEAAVCYAEAVNMEGSWAMEIHAIDYMVYAYLQLGDNSNASAQSTYMATMHKVNPSALFAAAYPFTAVPCRIVLENKRWKEAAAIELHESDLEWQKFPWQKAILHFTRSLGASKSNDVAKAESELEHLQSLQKELADAKDEYKATQVQVQVLAAKAWLNFAKGDQENALKLMNESADMEDKTGKHPVTPGEVLPARELLGDMLMELGKEEDAFVEYQKNLKVHPNRFNAIVGAARACHKLGDMEGATKYYSQIQNLTKDSNSDRPEVAEAYDFIEKYGVDIEEPSVSSTL